VACLRVTGNVALVKLPIDAGPTAPSHVDVRIEDAGFSGDLRVTDAQPASR
jgi:hypothetical protein